jgi:dCTP deaminase
MSLLYDKEIQRLAELDVFLPFVGEKRRSLDSGTKAISYGLSQAGYDIRLSPDSFLVFDGKEYKGRDKPTLDPKCMPISGYEAPLNHGKEGSWFILPPHSFGLGVSLELISMPPCIIGLCDGKSTYARCGVISNICPIEPGWSGYLTMCFVNSSAFPVRMYANEGVCQVMLHQLDGDVGQSYAGQYQNQSNVVMLSKVG